MERYINIESRSIICYDVNNMKNLRDLTHHGLNYGFMAGVLLLVMLPVLSSTGVLHQVTGLVSHDTAAQNTFSANPPAEPAQSTREAIPSGTYAGWAQYHHNVLGFSVNIPGGIQADELPQTRAEKPRYPEFVLQMHQNVNGIENETARITVYDSTLAVNVQAQDRSTDALFANTPVKQTGSLVGHKTVQYFYQGDTRTALYLIDDGQRTYEIRGLVDSTNPAVVAQYWSTFNSLLKSFALDSAK
jgi:hypothetical protein